MGLSTPQQPDRAPARPWFSLPGEAEIVPSASRVRRLRRRLLTVSRLHDFECLGRRVYPCMVTLTYADGDAWRPDHLGDYLRRVRKWWGRQGFGSKLRYVWVAELQARGALHYHVVFWMPAGVILPKSDRRGWWPHGSTRTEAARAPVAYVMKYASKCENPCGRFPEGARIHGGGGLAEARRIASWWTLPAWARDLFGVGECRRAVGGGVVDRDGVIVGSPWRVELVCGSVLCRQVCSWLDGFRPGEVAGPYSTLPEAA